MFRALSELRKNRQELKFHGHKNKHCQQDTENKILNLKYDITGE